MKRVEKNKNAATIQSINVIGNTPCPKRPLGKEPSVRLSVESLCVHISRVTVSETVGRPKAEEQDTGKNKVKRVGLLVLKKVFYGIHVMIKITLVTLSMFV